MEKCRLCRKIRPLEGSHILPKFVYKWLKINSGTGYLRFGDKPNVRVQDGKTIKWLCGECEDKFEKWETEFCKKAFHTYLNDTTSRIGYGQWMLKFSVSLTWRVLTYISEIHGLTSFSPEFVKAASEAEHRWRSFLLDQEPHPSVYEQHFIPLDFIASTDISNVPKNINRYIALSTDMDAVSNPENAFIYCKFPKMIFIGFISIGDRKVWKGTKIHVKHGCISQSGITIPEGVGRYILGQSDKMAGAWSSLSDKQVKKISEQMIKDKQKVINSTSFNAMKADVQLFGDDAFF